ncbi:MAG TPA: hypothetical protein VHA55_00595 [Pseudorhodoplanes sp.]|nr:hypothetical protein [Pseudorhodoplanes sp.]
MKGYRFRIGQQVELLHSTLRSAADGRYRITALLPLESDGPKYRLKGNNESYERVVAEHDLLETADDSE